MTNFKENKPILFLASERATNFFPFKGDISKTFKGMEKMFFGVELELNISLALQAINEEEGKDTRSEVVSTLFNFIKDDCIMTHEMLPHGFEIKTAPATYEYQLAFWNRFFDFIEKNPRLFQPKGTNCGMHIHLSKDGFKNDFHTSRTGYFIHAEHNRELINKIAQRESIFLQLKVPSGFIKKKVGNYNYDYYNNRTDYRNAFHTNTYEEKTVECRIFQSSLNRADVLKNLEFMHVLLRFTRSSVAKEHKEKLTTAAFNEFLEKRKSSYPNLWNHLNSENKIDTDVVMDTMSDPEREDPRLRTTPVAVMVED